MALDLSNMCRTCLESEKSCMIPLFDANPGKSSSVFEMFQSITSINIEHNDGMPAKICLACFTEINRSYSFKIKCEASDQTLRQLLEIKKTEDSIQPKNNEIIKSEIEISQGFEDLFIEAKKNNPMEIEEENDSFEAIENNVDYSNDEEDKDMNNKEESKTVSEYILKVESTSRCKETHNRSKRTAKRLKNFEDQLSNAEHIDLSIIKSIPNDDEDNEFSKFDSYNPNPLETQIKSRQKENFKCPHCPTDFVFLKNLNKHLDWHKKTFDTQSQFKNYSSDSVIVQKEDSSSKEIVFETSTIDADGEEILTAATIEEIVEESAIKPAVKDIPESCSFSCENCGAGFQTERSLNFHRNLNRCMEKQFECLVCHKIFISKITLIDHIKIHTENFQCSKCMKEFDLEEDFKNHMDIEHVSGKAIKNQCSVCKKCFTMLSALKDHMRVHSGEKPFICETCGRGFSQSTNLKQHTMRHSNIKPFKCAQCPCEFVSKGELNSHMRKHTGEHPFVCDTCGSGFTTSSSLKKHIRIHTGERPYACEFCPMRFAALGTLKNHRRTHTGEKPYLCRFCGRGFAQQSDRVTHERTHTGERPYVCSVCGSAFQQNGALKIHMKLHAEGRNSQSNSRKRKINTDNVIIHKLDPENANNE